MLITFTLLIVLSLGALIVSIYSSILPFAQNIGNIENHNQAYYEAYANVERALLVSKYQGPGFSGSGLYLSTNENHGINLHNIQESYRTIQGKTKKIPAVDHTKDPYIQDEETSYNKAYLGDSIHIPLTIDTTNSHEDYYDTQEADNTIFNGNTIALTIKLPDELYRLFGRAEESLLCDREQTNCLLQERQVVDNSIRNRSIQGTYLGDDFMVLPYTETISGVEFDTVDYTKDTNIRESSINNESTITPNITRDNTFNPIKNNGLAHGIGKQNVIGTGGFSLQGDTFQKIFTNENIHKLALQLDVINKALSRNGIQYPFLLYQIQSDVAIPNLYYTIRGVATINDYKVTIQIDKSL